MHEASIALSIIDIASKECAKAGCTKVVSIEVNVGSASSIVPESLAMAFDVVKMDTPASSAKLTINEIPLRGHCEDCGGDFEAREKFILSCPLCEGGRFKIKSGRELDITEIEVE